MHFYVLYNVNCLRGICMAKNVAETVKNLIESAVVEAGYILWDVEFVKEGSERYLRITIDNDKGITIDDCEAVHHMIDPMLDEADPIDVQYHLEVSSPGIERVLRTPEHFEACIGENIELRLFTVLKTASGNIKSLTGVLTAYDRENDAVSVTVTDGTVYELKRSDISKVKTVFDFE